ncbi:MAG: hypothetical protein QOJ29_1859 [Thermoleophilaceae bacterium]|jgi:hypothetical protein|nr:hypothetical protein [Thermoleophilaceae bacterium]
MTSMAIDATRPASESSSRSTANGHRLQQRAWALYVLPQSGQTKINADWRRISSSPAGSP